MFGIGRRRTRRELVKGELGESFDHFMQAATHAASGVGATVGPRVNAARELVAPAADRVRRSASNGWGSAVTALVPLAIAAAEGARQAGGAATRKAKSKKPSMMRKRGASMSRKRWPTLAGLLAAGAVAGAAGAMLRKRRTRQQWDEYDPSGGLDPVHADTAMAGPSSGASSDDGMRASVTSAVGHDGAAMTGSTDATADLTMSDQPAAPMTGSTKQHGDPLATDVASNAGAGSRNSQS